MVYQAPVKTIKEIEELMLLAEETIAEILGKMKELGITCQECQELFSNPAFLGDRANPKQSPK